MKLIKSLSAILGGLMFLHIPLCAENIMVNNTNRNYIVYAPKNLGTGRPLLISCHGMNQDAAYQKGMLSIESVADTAKFVTVFPNGIDKSWDIGGDRDLKFMEALIDEMVAKYEIDRNRVYISGFSMGGMFTYHAATRMADKFAAFAPISGYPMGGGTYTSSRPVPIIHTHGTSDDVVGFSGVSGILAGWVKRNGCNTKATVVKKYRNAPHITRHTWSGGENGVEVVLMEMADKGHWISNDYGVKTGDEIWKFCKRYSLELKDPSVRITAPDNGLTYLTIGGESEVPAHTLKATASDPDGQVVKVAFYKGTELLAEVSEPPYEYTLEGLTKGEHTIRAVVTDDEGRTGSAQIAINVEEPTNYVFTNCFNSEGCVPEGWSTYDGKEKRTGFSSGFSSGSRLFHFTNETRDFEWGLYTRNVTGGARSGYARFADKGTSTTLTLYPGNYQIYTRVSNWNIESFSPVTVAVETIDGKQIHAETFTPTANIGNSASNAFSGVTLKNFTFDILEKDRYVITFYTADAPWADLVVGQASIRRKGEVNNMDGVAIGVVPQSVAYYDLSGRRVQTLTRGIYIQQTVTESGQRICKKIIIP